MLYSVGRSGIGQSIRAQRLADYLQHALGNRVEILMVTGVPNGDRLFGSPRRGVVAPDDVVKLTESVSSGMTSGQVGELRLRASQGIESLVKRFAPDVFVTTSHRGVAGELDRVLEVLRVRRCRLVLALRDIYYPARYVEDYETMSGAEFDLVLIGGPAAVRKWVPVGLIGGPLDSAINFAGYLRPLGQAQKACGSAATSSVLCQVGGGRDGGRLAQEVLAAVDRVRQRMKMTVLFELATGPLMPDQDVRTLQLAATIQTRVTTWSEVGLSGRCVDPDLVVSMAGYNSCVEAAWTGRPTIIIPRQDPNDQEQPLRATLFSEWFNGIQSLSASDGGDLTGALAGAIQRLLSTRHDRSELSHAEFFADPISVALDLVGERETPAVSTSLAAAGER
jgi:predicted glycosyltransferase